MDNQEILLTHYSHGSGCGCKIAPAVLEKVLHSVPDPVFPDLLVGYESNDDAAVYDTGQGPLLISTVDFFTPIVDDPFDFGKIAAANALSDVYAMGGKPFLATAILGFPVEKIPVEIVREILAGGRYVCKQAGIPLAGGHSIDSPEPFFGLSVNGSVSQENLKRNNSVRKGDVLYLTKPIGTGIVAAALKRGKASPGHVKAFVEQMTTLNSVGEILGRFPGVHAMTDVTGFGLLGHLIEMAGNSPCSAQVEMHKVKLLPGVKEYAEQFIFPDNVYRNWNSVESKVQGVKGPEFITLCDPQTNGGLLISLDPSEADSIIRETQHAHPDCDIFPVGRIIEKTDRAVTVLT